MRKTNQITYNIPRGTGFDSTSISGFKGLQLSDNPLSVDPNSSLDMKNVYLNDSGALSTRPRIEYEKSYISSNNDYYYYGASTATSMAMDEIISYTILNDYINIVQAEKSNVILLIIERTINGTIRRDIVKNETDITISTSKVTSFLKNDKIYILNGSSYLVIKPTTDLTTAICNFEMFNIINDEDTYIPILYNGTLGDTALISVEKYNQLRNKGVVSYFWDGNESLNDLEIYKNYYYKDAMSDATNVGDINDAPKVEIVGGFEHSRQKFEKDKLLFVGDADYNSKHLWQSVDLVNKELTLGEVFTETDFTTSLDGTTTLVGCSPNQNKLLFLNVSSNVKLYIFDKTKNQFKLIFSETSTDNSDFVNLKLVHSDIFGGYYFCNNEGSIIITPMSSPTGTAWRVISYDGSNYVDGGACCPEREGLFKVPQKRIFINKDFNAFVTFDIVSGVGIQSWYKNLGDDYVELSFSEYGRLFYEEASPNLKYYVTYGAGVGYMYISVGELSSTTITKTKSILLNDKSIINENNLLKMWIDDYCNVYILTYDSLYCIFSDDDEIIKIKEIGNPNDFFDNILNYSIPKVFINNIDKQIYLCWEIRTTDFVTNFYIQCYYYDNDPKNNILISKNVNTDIIINFTKHIKFNNNYWFYGNSNKLWYTTYNDPTYIGEYNYIDVGDSKRVTGLLVISDNILMAFKEDKIFIIQANILENDTLYTCTEVKGDVGNIPIGQTLITKHSEVPLMIDDSGVYTIKQLTNVTLSEHTTQSISFNMDKKFIKEINKDKIITHNYLYWTYLIFPGTTAKVYVLDNRTFEWYYWELPEGNIVSIWNTTETIDGLLYQISQYITKEGNVYSLRTTDKLNQIDFTNSNEYYTSYNDILFDDEVGIEWFWESQILPLNLTKYSKGYSALGYSKVLYETNFLFADSDADDEFSLKYSFKAYRKMLSDAGTKSTNGTLNYIRSVTQRTYIPRFSFLQVKLENNEFNNDYQTNIPNHNNKLNLIQLKFKYKLMEEIK